MTCLARTTAAAGALLGPAAAGADVLVGRLPGAARRQRESLRHRAHRPWPLPDARWVMAQSWVDLLFCHWPVDEAQLRAHVPASLPLDRFDGRAWLSITPFEVQGTRPRGALPPPVLSRFPELNVRTYVVRDGKPGIWFFSLDAASALAVAAARGLYRLPYLRARMRIARDGDWIDYRSERSDPRGAPARFDARYRGTGRGRDGHPQRAHGPGGRAGALGPPLPGPRGCPPGGPRLPGGRPRRAHPPLHRRRRRTRLRRRHPPPPLDAAGRRRRPAREHDDGAARHRAGRRAARPVRPPPGRRLLAAAPPRRRRRGGVARCPTRSSSAPDRTGSSPPTSSPTAVGTCSSSKPRTSPAARSAAPRSRATPRSSTTSSARSIRSRSRRRRSAGSTSSSTAWSGAARRSPPPIPPRTGRARSCRATSARRWPRSTPSRRGTARRGGGSMRPGSAWARTSPTRS